jgi:energy-coupling factor transporter ATP-binding protein EcfA2
MIDGTRPPRRRLAHDAYELSSGEISFLTFAAQVCLDIENGSLLLIDEPETHLHPQLVSSFSSLLNSLLSATGSIAILATHSVFVVREVFREQVTVLRRSPEGVTVAARPTLRTFGADPGAISFFVFGEDRPSSLASDVKANLAATDMSWDELYEEYGDELSLEFMGELRNDRDGADASE